MANEIYDRVAQGDVEYLQTHPNFCFVLDQRGRSLLFYAVMAPDLGVLNVLLDYQVDVNKTDFNQETPLFEAIRRRRIDFVIRLFQHGADLTKRNSQGETPFHLACKSGNFPIYQFLIENGCSTDSKTQVGALGLHYCIVNDQLPFFIDVFRHTNTAITVLDDKKNNLLHYAAKTGSLTILKYLLENGVDPNSLNDIYENPLFAAVRSRNEVVVKTLIEAHSFLDLINRNYETPVTVANNIDDQAIAGLLERAIDSLQYAHLKNQYHLIYLTLKRDFAAVKETLTPYSRQVRNELNKNCFDYARELNLVNFINLFKTGQ
jgi:ankyrin repeat protein